MTSKEYIICSAIHFEDGKSYAHQPKNIKSGFVIAGRRHHNCFMTIVCVKGKELKNVVENEQGFLTNLDRFVNRKEGGVIAFEADQTVALQTTLYSEDLY